MQRAGFFVLYRHTSLPIEVQGYFVNRGWFSEVCGFAVRSAGDLYVVNYCGRRGFYSKVYQCDQLSLKASITNLQVISSSTSYTVTLPTGGRVVLSTRRITIYPSVADYGRTEGLCGTLNNNANDDFKMKGTNSISSNVYTFAETWRVSDANSLFYGKIIDERNFKDTVFCGCDNSSIASCGYTENLENCISQGHDETDKLKRRCGLSRRRRDLSDNLVDDEDDEMHFVYDRNFNPPHASWRNGWTQTTAQQYCETYFNNRNSVNLCENVKGVDVPSMIEVCVQNIYISGGTNYTQDGLKVIITTCVEEIGKNDTLRNMTETDSNGNVVSVADNLLNSLCPADCNDRGTCQKGECVCNGHFTGKDCSLDSNHVPTLQDLLYDGLCDFNSKTCNVTSVFGDLFINSTDLKCKLQVLKLDKSPITTQTEHTAEYGTFQKIYCPVLQSQAPYVLSIAVKNKISYSGSEYLIVYNSICWNCTHFNCTKVPTSCVIDQKCYTKGDMKPNTVNYICDPDNNEYQWTEVKKPTAPTTVSAETTITSTAATTTSTVASITSSAATSTSTVPITTLTTATSTSAVPITTSTTTTTTSALPTTTSTTATSTSAVSVTTSTTSTSTSAVPTTTSTTATSTSALPTTTSTIATSTSAVPITTSTTATSTSTIPNTTLTTATSTLAVPTTTSTTATSTSAVPITTSTTATSTSTVPITTLTTATSTSTVPITTSTTATSTSTVPITTSSTATSTSAVSTTTSTAASTTSTVATTTSTTAITSMSTTPSNKGSINPTASSIIASAPTTFKVSPSTSMSSSSADQQKKSSNSIAIAAGVSVSLIVVIGIIICILVKTICKKNKRPINDHGYEEKQKSDLHDTNTGTDNNVYQGQPLHIPFENPGKPHSTKYDYDGRNYVRSRPGSAQSTKSNRPVSPDPTLHFEENDEVDNYDDISPVIPSAWGPVDHTKGTTFNFKEMRPKTGTRRNNELPPLS